MGRTRVRWGRVGVTVATAALTVSFLAGRAGAGASHRPETRTYVVRPADTLWGIASRLVGPANDPRPTVDRLGRANHVRAGIIYVGEVLVVPAS